MEKKKVGFIGLVIQTSNQTITWQMWSQGEMGSQIVKILLSKGYLVTGWNRSQERAQPLLSEGLVLTKTPAEVAQSCDLIFVMLTNGEGNKNIFLSFLSLLSHCESSCPVSSHWPWWSAWRTFGGKSGYWYEHNSSVTERRSRSVGAGSIRR